MNIWIREIERARTSAEIVAIARDYCALLHPRELEALPQDCRELRIDDEGDIARLRERLDGTRVAAESGAEGERMRALATYISRAAQRLGELRDSA